MHDYSRPEQRVSKREGRFDPFQSFLCENATFTPDYDLIQLKPTDYVPECIITFSEARNPKRDDPEASVAFFENDAKFWAFVRNPKRYLPMLKRHPAVIMPDISTNYDMPAPVKWHSVFQNYAFAHWLQEQGLTVIPNARPVLPFPLDATLGGIPKHSVIAIGAHGNLKRAANRQRFITGVRSVCEYLQPSFLVVYGSDLYEAFAYPKAHSIPIRFYPSSISVAHTQEKDGSDER